MTKKQYAAVIAALGLTQVEAARFLGVNERTSRRWAIGERDVPEPVARFLRFLLAAKITPEQVERVLSKR